jgi:hypothetical protein
MSYCQNIKNSYLCTCFTLKKRLKLYNRKFDKAKYLKTKEK